MRGILFSSVDGISVQGITPAHAGNTINVVPAPMRGGDHPRACGEYKKVIVIFGARQGSPPRMRGIRVRHFLVVH